MTIAIFGALGGPLLGIFLLGMTWKRANSRYAEVKMRKKMTVIIYTFSFIQTAIIRIGRFTFEKNSKLKKN